MDALTILKVEHEIITEIYDWLNEPEGAERKMQYVLGVHDFASNLLGKLEFQDQLKKGDKS